MEGNHGQDMRNLGIIAHIDAGKTTLTERILYETGCVRYCGEVREGTTVSDFLLQERERGISIVSAAVSCDWRGVRLNLIDTPGHVDFTSEVERSLRVMDGVVAVFCGVHGVQAQSETVWRRSRRYGLSALAFVNKLDRETADFGGVVRQIRERFRVNAVPLQLPLYRGGQLAGLLSVVDGHVVDFGEVDGGLVPTEDEQLNGELGREELVEALAETDDEILRVFLQSERPTAAMLKRALREAVRRCQLLPVLAGSAEQDRGVRELLDAVVDFLPSPQEIIGKKPMSSCGGRGSRAEGGNSDCCCALVFKVVSEDWQGSWLAVRIYSGEFRPGQSLKVAGRNQEFQVQSVLRLRASDVEEIPYAGPGDVVGLGGEVTGFRTGDTLFAGTAEISLEGMDFPEPVVSQAVEGLEAEDRQRLPELLARAAIEDPTLKVRFDDEAGQWQLSGMGELHLAVVLDRLRTEAGLRTRCGAPRVNLRATVAETAEVRQEFVKNMTAEVRFRAGLRLKVEPLPRGSGMAWDWRAMERNLPTDCQEAVRRGLQEGVETGCRSGIPLTDTRVTVLEVSYVAEESSELAFLTVSRQALEEALRVAGVIVLEPVMRLEVSSPQDQVGNVLADLQMRRGRISELDALAPEAARVVALVPLAEMFGYASALRSLTAGRADFVAEPAGFEPRSGKAGASGQQEKAEKNGRQTDNQNPSPSF